mmetsp:Transcript_14021/g.29502  ORF Transcript_14021/g.29502 Transcript_14021/m.29502 type:complete len:96 (+) Transcript_14021:138-425(+)
MKRILQNGIFDEELGWEGLGLPASYSGWTRTSENHMWDFYGAQLEQGGTLETKHHFQHIFMKFCHVIVLLLALFNRFTFPLLLCIAKKYQRVRNR